MARIVQAFLQRPHADKSKRVLRIPVGGHTEKTLLRGQPEHVVMIDEAGCSSEITGSPEVQGLTLPYMGAWEPLSLALEGVSEKADFEGGENPSVEGDDELEEDCASAEIAPNGAVATAASSVEEPALGDDVLDETSQEEAEETEPEPVAPLEPESKEEALEPAPEEASGEKFEVVEFLAQKPAEIKAALASGKFDSHLAEIEAAETSGGARKAILAAITARASA